MPPPGTRLIGMNPNGTSRWAGANGVEVDVDHNHPLMGDYAREIARAQAAPVPAGVAPQARYADNTTPQQPNQSTMADYGYGQSLPVEDITSPAPYSPNAPLPMSPDPNAGRPQMSVAPEPIMSDPDAYEAARRQQEEFSAANPPMSQAAVTFMDDGTGPVASDGGTPYGGSYIIRTPGSPVRNVEVVRGRSVSEQSGDAPMPGLVEGVRSDADTAASAQRHLGKYEQEAMAQTERTLQKRNEELNAMYNRSAQADAERAAGLEQARRNFEDIATRARSMTVDPDRRSGGDRVLGAVASFLGGIGSALTGGPNQALQVVQHAIDRDLDAQRANVANAQHGVESSRTAYQLARDQGASERDAERIHMAYEYERAANEAQRLAASTGSQEAMDRAELLIQPMLMRADELRANVNHLQSPRRSETTQYGTQRVGGGGREDMTVPYRNRLTGQIEMRTIQQMNAETEAWLGHNATAEQRTRWQLGAGYMPGTSAAGPEQLSNESLGRIQRFTEHAAQFTGAMQALTNLQRILNSREEDLPGSGPLAGRLNRYLVGEEGRSMRQAISLPALLAVYAASGKQVGAQEMERLEETVRLVHSASPDEIRNGITALDSLVGAPYRALLTGLGTEERAELTRRQREVGGGVGTSAASSSDVRGTPIGARR